MNPAMERVIKHLFQKDQEGTSRHLKLIPGNWRVTMTQFDPDWIDDPNYAGLMPFPPREYLDDDEDASRDMRL